MLALGPCEMQKLSVIGAGQMGGGIAQVAAQIAKIPQVILFDRSETQLNRQMKSIRQYLEKSREKGSISGEIMDSTLNALKPTIKIELVDQSDFFIEVSNERILFSTFFLIIRR